MIFFLFIVLSLYYRTMLSVENKYFDIFTDFSFNGWELNLTFKTILVYVVFGRFKKTFFYINVVLTPFSLKVSFMRILG